MTSRIIQSGRLPDLRNDVTTLRRLENLSFFCCEVSSFIRTRSSPDSSSMLTMPSSSLIASAPILATKAPGWSRVSSRKRSSVSSSFSLTGASPGSMTM